VVDVGKGVRIGGRKSSWPPGRARWESAEQVQAIAERVARLGAKLLRGGAFKTAQLAFTPFRAWASRAQTACARPLIKMDCWWGAR